MDVSIIGAGGAIGRQIAITLIQERILESSSRLQLVGHYRGRSEQILDSIASDLMDAFNEIIPKIESVFDPEEVRGDIIIFAAGHTTVIPQDLNQNPDRRSVARKNLPLFESYARAIAKTGHGNEIILVVTNPVELGVDIFARNLHPSRTIGTGAFLDTLRFRGEIATELGIRRSDVQGLVLGEHGKAMVPCWSTVRVSGYTSPDAMADLGGLRRKSDPDRDSANKEARRLMAERNSRDAFRYVNSLGVELRTVVKPWLIFLSEAKAIAGTANSVARLVEIIVKGKQILTAAQVAVRGEFLNIKGVTGAPVIISNQGVQIEPIELWPEEADAVRAAELSFKSLLEDIKN